MITSKTDFSATDKLIKSAKKKYVAQIGVFSAKDGRDDGLSNATIGFVHEFGSLTNGIPQRSFLRMPLGVHANELRSVMGTKLVKKWLALGNFKKVMEIVGIKAEEIVMEAFSTRGFGRWAPNSTTTVAKKGSDSPLIDTAELRKSIGSRVV